MDTVDFILSHPDIYRTSIGSSGIEVWAKLLNNDYLVYRAYGKNFEHADAFYDVFIAGDTELDFGNRSIVRASFMLSDGI